MMMITTTTRIKTNTTQQQAQAHQQKRKQQQQKQQVSLLLLLLLRRIKLLILLLWLWCSIMIDSCCDFLPPVSVLFVSVASASASDNNHGSNNNIQKESSSSSLSSWKTTKTPSRSRRRMVWDNVPLGSSDSILGIAQSYKECTHPNKVNVCVGAYRNEYGLPWILPSVLQAEEIILEKQSKNTNNNTTNSSYDHEYLPMDGDMEYIRYAMEFAYGKDIVSRCTIAAIQTLSGTGACRIGAEFIKRFYHTLYNSSISADGNTTTTSSSQSTKNHHPLLLPAVYVPDPTWNNHYKIFHDCGFPTVTTYRYYHRETNTLDIDGLLYDLEYKAPRGSVIVLHVCAHNPTGCDPTIHEWKRIYNVIKKQQHIVFFDCAYQGFATGNPINDGIALRQFVIDTWLSNDHDHDDNNNENNDNNDYKIPILLAQSFAKNFGLYGERCGTLSIVCGAAAAAATNSSVNMNNHNHNNEQQQIQEQEEVKNNVMSQLRSIVRPMYSSPPKHGSSIVKTILSNHTLREQYYHDLMIMSTRIHEMRQLLVHTLKTTFNNNKSTTEYNNHNHNSWDHITKQIGMFAYTGLTKQQCIQLMKQYSIYMTHDGRISIAGLNKQNIQYVASAIHNVTTTTQQQ